MRTTKQKPRAAARGSCLTLCVACSVPAELVVHAGAEDVVIELDVARRDVQARSTEGRSGERGVVVELDIEILALDRPAVAERVFQAAAHRPTAAGIALLMAGGGLGADEKLGRVDLGPRTAAGHVQKRLVPKPAPAAYAEPAARGDEPALLSLRNPVGPAVAEEGHEAHFEILAFLVVRLAVAFEANDPHAGLIVAASLEAADEAGQVEVACDAGSSRNRGYYSPSGDPQRCRCGDAQPAAGQDRVPNRAMGAPSARVTRVRADIAAAPGVDRSRRRRWCICRHPPIGSECRRRRQAQRDQRYASEK